MGFNKQVIGRFKTLSKSLPLGGEGGPRGIKIEREVKQFRAARMR